MSPYSDEPPATTYFDVFVSCTQDLLRGDMDPVAYEDKMRAIYGVESYITTTLDKLIRSCARQVCESKGGGSNAVSDQCKREGGGFPMRSALHKLFFTFGPHHISCSCKR